MAFNEDSLQCKSIFKYSFLYALLKPLVYFLNPRKGTSEAERSGEDARLVKRSGVDARLVKRSGVE